MCDVIYVDDATHSLEVVINVDENHLDAVINELDLEVNPEGYTFIRNGEEEINAYMQNIVMPDLKKFVLDKKSEIKQTTAAEVLVAKTKLDTYVSGACQSDLDDYTDECESQIDTYVQDKKNILDVCVNQCSEYKSETESILSSVNDCADEVQSEIADFNASVTQKQSEINASVLLAQNWATQTDGLVDETDYSAKKYALDAKADALLSKQYSQKASFGNIGDVKYTVSTVVPNGGAWCDGAEYTQAQFPDVYQMLVDGKLSSTDYSIFNNSVSTNGYCALFALDSSAQKFKVPKLLDKYVMDLADDVPVVGNGMALGISGVASSAVVTRYLLSGRTYSSLDRFGLLCASSVNGLVGNTGSEGNFDGNTLVGLTTDPEKSGIIADTTSAKKVAVLKAYVVLYSSAAGASEVQAAEFIQGLSGKANTDLSNVSSNIDYVVESYQNGSSWYRIYKSGWVEQGGVVGTEFDTTATSSNMTISLLKPFSSVNYTVFVTLSTKYSTLDIDQIKLIAKTSTDFTTRYTCSKNWMACGQGAN